MLVIDCDRKPNGPDGVKAFDDLCVASSLDRRSWFVVATPSNGFHYYFRTDAGHGNSRGSLPPGIDVRGKGGYVIGPGALLPDGRTYSVVNGSWDTIPELPEALASFLKTREAVIPPLEIPASPEGPISSLPSATEGDRKWAANALASACNLIRKAPVGERNNTLFVQSAAIGEIAANAPDEWERIRGMLLAAAVESGLEEDKSWATITSGFQKGVKNRRKLPSEKVPDIPLDGLINSVMSSNSAHEAPRPLRRESAIGEPFPIEALGHTLHWAAYAISDKIQCPQGMAALSVLGAASLAVQAHADVKLPASGQIKPLSLFLVSVGESGERKSAADSEAIRAVRLHEKELGASYTSALSIYRDRHDTWEAARVKILKGKNENPLAMAAGLASLGPEPIAPLIPILTCPEPTFEGLCNLYQGGYPALGLFSDEGGQFVGGHGMSNEAKGRTIAGLSSLWDGSPIKRVRATRESTVIMPGRRLAMHLMMQPGIASGLLSDPVLKEQGFLSRLLVSQPPSTTGTRFQRPLNPHTEEALDRYTNRLLAILRQPPAMAFGKFNELEPRVIHLDDAARLIWDEYSNSIERELGPGGKWETVKRFAGKLPENATRIAGVLSLFEDLSCPLISVEAMQRGIIIANHFAGEALRLFDASAVSPEIVLAEKLLEWLHQSWTEEYVPLSAIYQRGPNAIRDARTARSVVSVLADHGWLIKATPGTLIDGKAVKEAWRVVQISILSEISD